MDGNQPVDRDSGFPRVSQPALRALAGAGFTTLEQLTGTTEAELSKLHGMGPKGIRILREALAARGLSFAQYQRKSKGAEQNGR